MLLNASALHLLVDMSHTCGMYVCQHHMSRLRHQDFDCRPTALLQWRCNGTAMRLSARAKRSE